jgi:hypothetical protein
VCSSDLTEMLPFVVKDGQVEGFTLKVSDRLERTTYYFTKVFVE